MRAWQERGGAPKTVPCRVPTAVRVEGQERIGDDVEERGQDARGAGDARSNQDGELSLRVRIAAIVIGALAVLGGAAAVFLSDNQAGTAALFVLGAAFLACGVFGLLPSGITVGGASVQLAARAALATVERLASDPDPDVRDKAADTYGQELEERGLVLPADVQAERVINGFVRAGSLEARTVADRLSASGWMASSPSKSRYIRWTYEGPAGGAASLYQNVGDLAVNRREQMEAVAGLPGGRSAANGREIRFPYTGGIDEALRAADVLRQLAEESSN